MTYRICFITGPTASGKSSLALDLADIWDAEIINCDSMQVYADLQLLTARPDSDELARVPHHLYGHIDGAETYDVAAYAAEAGRLAQRLLKAGKNIIFVGGTGLYFKALVDGLASVPDIPEVIRAGVLALADTSAEALYAALTEEDPIMAQRLNEGDRQRVGRALEVVRATGTSLSDFQKQDHSGPLASLMTEGMIYRVRLLPDREALYQRCNQRLAVMLENGGLDEIATLLKRGLPDRYPVMRALGVPQLRAYLEGHQTYGDAVDQAAMHTRRFAKRQLTWIRNQFRDWNFIELKYNNQEKKKILQYMSKKLLTTE